MTGAENESHSETSESLVAPSRSGFVNLMVLAWPLIVSNSFTTLQITIDRLFLSKFDADAAAAATAATMVYWLPYIFLFSIAGYVAAFVAQYIGAGRPHRVGPAVWHGIYVSIAGSLLILCLIPCSDFIFQQMGHSVHLQQLESQFFKFLCWSTVGGAITAAISGFFSGRGESVIVIYISAVGMLVTAILDYLLIFGNLGFPRMGISGAGWATVAGAGASAITGILFMLRKRYRSLHGTDTGWRFEWPLMRRLLRFGVPGAAQWALDITAFNAFIIITGWFSDEALAASGLTITINNVAFIPMLGVGQAVSILVGKHLGENKAHHAAHMTWLGLAVAVCYMAFIGLFYVFTPALLIGVFESDNTAPEKWALIAEHTHILLRFVVVFLLFDAVNIVISFALRGAGDTVFVSLVSLAFAWPVMVIPTYFAWKYDWGFYWAWAFASAYIILQALCMLWRFRGGKWRSMRVIENAVIETDEPQEEADYAAIGR